VSTRISKNLTARPPLRESRLLSGVNTLITRRLCDWHRARELCTAKTIRDTFCPSAPPSPELAVRRVPICEGRRVAPGADLVLAGSSGDDGDLDRVAAGLLRGARGQSWLMGAPVKLARCSG
jgi:hypothetical protein